MNSPILILNICSWSSEVELVGESVDLVVTCPDDEETTVPVKIYIDEIEISKDDEHNRDIENWVVDSHSYEVSFFETVCSKQL